MTPLGSRVLVTPKPDVTESKGGVLLAKDVKEKPMEGTVIAIGDKVREIQVGDVIIFEKYSGTLITINDEEKLVMDEEDVLAIRTEGK